MVTEHLLYPFRRLLHALSVTGQRLCHVQLAYLMKRVNVVGKATSLLAVPRRVNVRVGGYRVKEHVAGEKEPVALEIEADVVDTVAGGVNDLEVERVSPDNVAVVYQGIHRDRLRHVLPLAGIGDGPLHHIFIEPHSGGDAHQELV